MGLWRYGLRGSADIVGKDPLAVLNDTTNVFKLYAETWIPAKNTYLCVNGTGVIAANMNGMHHWSDEPSNAPDDEVHEFTRFTVEGAGKARAERDVKTIVLAKTEGDDAEAPIESTTFATMSLIVVAIKVTLRPRPPCEGL